MALFRALLTVGFLLLVIGESTFASDFYSEVRQAQTSDDEVVLLNIPRDEQISLRNWDDSSDPQSANGHCFGIVHLEQLFAAKKDELFEAGPKDHPHDIEEKLFQMSQLGSNAKISGYSSLSEFMSSPEGSEIIKKVIHRIQAAHKILMSSGITTVQIGQKVMASSLSNSSRAEIAVKASSEIVDPSLQIEKSIRTGKALHLFVRADQGQWGHSIQVVGFMKSKSTGQLKLIVKDSNSPDRLRVMSKENGSWTYTLKQDQPDQAVSIAVVEDGFETSPLANSILASIPNPEPKVLASAPKKNPLVYECQQADSQGLQEFMSGFNRIAAP